MFFEGNTHLPMEQHATLAQCDADNKLTLGRQRKHRTISTRQVSKSARDAAQPRANHRHAQWQWLRRQGDPFNHEIVVAKLALIARPPGEGDSSRGNLLHAIAAATRC